MMSPSTQKLGEYLRSEREKRQISIEQIASATKINIKLLHALESDNYDALPAKPFVRGFVANYARYIGLDPKMTMESFDSFLDENAGKKYKRPDNTPHIFVEKDATVDRSRTVLTVVMGAFLVIGIVVMAIVKPSMKRHRLAKVKVTEATNAQVYTVPLPSSDSAPEKSPEKPAVVAAVKAPDPKPAEKAAPASTVPLILAPKPVAEAKPTPKPTPKPAATPTPSAVAAATAPAAKPAEGKVKPPPIPDKEVRHKLVVKSHSDAWVKYQSDDRPVMAYMLRADKKIYIRARESIRFMTGNPKALEYSYNNGAFTQMKDSIRTIVVPEEDAAKYEGHLFTE